MVELKNDWLLDENILSPLPSSGVGVGKASVIELRMKPVKPDMEVGNGSILDDKPPSGVEIRIELRVLVMLNSSIPGKLDVASKVKLWLNKPSPLLEVGATFIVLTMLNSSLLLTVKLAIVKVVGTSILVTSG